MKAILFTQSTVDALLRRQDELVLEVVALSVDVERRNGTYNRGVVIKHMMEGPSEICWETFYGSGLTCNQQVGLLADDIKRLELARDALKLELGGGQ